MPRIALDIDSTLHPYWDLLAELSELRFGVKLPYEDQHGWGITALEPDQLRSLIEETHSDDNIIGAEPYPDAVETVKAWHHEGHWIHVTSHRAGATRKATERWLDQIGMPYDDLHCSYDKVTRCVELGIDVLVDDSPVNLENATAHGITGATIVHPWNAALIGRNGVVGAHDWRELRRRLEPVLAARARV
jgi:5'(3')-deoxyribonucleotidase